ncbi:GNAT family N-acetyltransferase [Uliginosibacterium sp. H1]|uniref:GNAT family N-acetyltransferase n=1 Tax=Uliginosibacterium sp. H1 TaxID=3114757 RepID=UPI002E172226|nr:GNAT family N-acetyltransferase [Uliginosibacterium sp. H1]
MSTQPRHDLRLAWQWLPFDALTVPRLHALLRLRQDVFIIEQECRFHDIDGLDPVCWHGLGTSPAGELVACARIVPPAATDSPVPKIGRVAVAPGWRGQGHARVLMMSAIDFTRGQYPATPIFLSAQIHLEDFYSSLGFRRSGADYEDAGIMHCDMLLPAGA